MMGAVLSFETSVTIYYQILDVTSRKTIVLYMCKYSTRSKVNWPLKFIIVNETYRYNVRIIRKSII
jgi:hypothetical protein